MTAPLETKTIRDLIQKKHPELDQEIKMNKSEDYKNDHYFFTGKLSDITRNLSFMGFGAVWILAGGLEYFQNKDVNLPFIWIMLFLSISLVLDLFQYTYQSFFTYCMFSKTEKIDEKRKKLGKEPGVYTHSKKCNYPSYTLTILKVISMITAYSLLIRYLILTIF